MNFQGRSPLNVLTPIQAGNLQRQQSPGKFQNRLIIHCQIEILAIIKPGCDNAD